MFEHGPFLILFWSVRVIKETFLKITFYFFSSILNACLFIYICSCMGMKVMDFRFKDKKKTEALVKILSLGGCASSVCLCACDLGSCGDCRAFSYNRIRLT